MVLQRGAWPHISIPHLTGLKDETKGSHCLARTTRSRVHNIRGNTSMRSCARGVLQRLQRTSDFLPDISRAYCCCLQFWFTIACVFLDKCPYDQHMHYVALDF